MSRNSRQVLAVVLALLLVFGGSMGAWAAVYDNDPTSPPPPEGCKVMKIDPPDAGEYTSLDGILTVTLKVYAYADKNEVLTLDWITNIAVCQVYLKGGPDPGGTMYYYPGGSTGDQNVGIVGGYGISHIVFYYPADPQGKICVTKVDDADDTPLEDWEFTLSEYVDGDWVQVGTKTTGTDGKACWDELEPGTYKVEETLKSGWTAVSPVGGSTTITLAAGETKNVEFRNEEVLPGTICVTKVDDNDDTPLGDWEFTLSKFVDGDWVQVGTKTTGTDGKACWNELQPGTYKVEETLKSDWTAISPVGGSTTVTLIAGQNEPLEFRNKEEQPGKICVTKYSWDDESNLSGWEFKLYQQNGNGWEQVGEAKITGTDGKACWDGLPAGTYKVVETVQNGWVCVDPSAGFEEINLAAGETEYVDFWNRQLAEICVIKVNDVDGKPLEGWEFTLYLEDGEGWVQVGTKTTGTDGKACWNGLEPGIYKVVETVKSGWDAVSPVDGKQEVILAAGDSKELTFRNKALLGKICVTKVDDYTEEALSGWTFTLSKLVDNVSIEVGAKETGVDGKVCWDGLQPGTYKVTETVKSGWVCVTYVDGTTEVTLSAGQTENLAFHNLELAQLCVLKLNDEDNSPLAGWEFTLSQLVEDTWVQIGSPKVTGQDGKACWNGLAPGIYKVVETVKSGWTVESPVGGEEQVTLVAGDSQTLTFRNKKSGNGSGGDKGSICGFKFNDLNRDGARQDGEPYLQGWTINLYDSAERQNPIRTGVTDADGWVCFTGLAPGTYYLDENLKSGWTQTTPTDGYFEVMLAANGSETVEFGNYRRSTNGNGGNDKGNICAYKFNDLNEDGIRQSNEPYLPGWVITLYDADGVQIGQPKTTDQDGKACFTNLDPGTYIVRETSRDGWTQTAPGTPDHFTVELGARQTRSVHFGNCHEEEEEIIIEDEPEVAAPPEPVEVPEEPPVDLPHTGGNPLVFVYVGMALAGLGVLIRRRF